MIRSFRHLGLQRFFEKGSKAGIQPKHEKKLRLVLSALNVADKPEQMNIPGFDWHPLSGWPLVCEREWELARHLHV